ncbi:MAG TPA: hypothetical protein VG826_14210 [Pirellulales bacterium]|nr:hypothetical protein [Pirellulales bacterium]
MSRSTARADFTSASFSALANRGRTLVATELVVGEGEVASGARSIVGRAGEMAGGSGLISGRVGAISGGAGLEMLGAAKGEPDGSVSVAAGAEAKTVETSSLGNGALAATFCGPAPGPVTRIPIIASTTETTAIARPQPMPIHSSEALDRFSAAAGAAGGIGGGPAWPGKG